MTTQNPSASNGQSAAPSFSPSTFSSRDLIAIGFRHQRAVLITFCAILLGAVLAARDMFKGTEIMFVSASAALLEAAKAEGLETLDPSYQPVEAH